MVDLRDGTITLQLPLQLRIEFEEGSYSVAFNAPSDFRLRATLRVNGKIDLGSEHSAPLRFYQEHPQPCVEQVLYGLMSVLEPYLTQALLDDLTEAMNKGLIRG